MNEIIQLDISKVINFTEAMITFDNAEIKQSALSIVEKYKNLIVTDEIVTDIKKEVTILRKYITQLEDQRKNIKKIYNTPLTTFELKIKETVAIFEDPINLLTQQLQKFEDDEKNKKLLKVKELINEMLAKTNLSDKYKGQIILRDKYLNVSESMPKIKVDLELQINTLLSHQANELKAKELEEQLKIERQKQIELAIEKRHELIAYLNEKHNTDVSYSEVRHLQTDVQVNQYYDAIIKPKINIPLSVPTSTLTRPYIQQPKKVGAISITGIELDDFNLILDGIKQMFKNVKVESSYYE